MMADVNIENHGSLVLIRPLTEAASDWLDENISEDAQHFGGAVVVGPRYVEAIVEGMQNDGLEVR
jgi:hypothetical protein